VVVERVTTRLKRASVSPLRLDTDAETSLDESCRLAAERVASGAGGVLGVLQAPATAPR
jgi:hypothetical protein